MPRADTIVIIPAYNEEDALPAVLTSLRARHPELDVVVVDDGSLDRTSEVARRAGVAVVTLPFNLGIGGALRAGFRYAVRHDYRRGIQLDADGQHDAHDIALLLAEVDKGVDLVIGSRFAGNGQYEAGWLRRWAMRVLQTGVRLLSGRRFSDTSSGFRAFGPRALELFAAQYPVDYMESVEALLLACASGLRVEEVPVQMSIRAGGLPSNRSFKLAYHYVRLLVVMAASAERRRRRPGTVPR